MSYDEILKMEEEERVLLEALRLKKEAITRLKKEQAEKEEKEEKERLAKLPLEINIVSLRDGYVTVQSRWRQDIFDLWKSTPGHLFKGYTAGDVRGIGVNMIPIGNWNECLKRLKELPNSIIKYADKLEATIDYELNAPPWEIDIEPDGKNFFAKVGPRTSSWTLRNLTSSVTWDFVRNGAIIPTSEGWRIPKRLEEEKVEGTVYTDAALVLITSQIEKRAKIDALAGMTDSDDERLDVLTRMVYKRGTWMKFRDAMEPFQRVGVVFALETNGKFILADDPGLGKTWQILAYSEIKRLEYEAQNKTWCCLVACKASNIPNWRREIERLTGIKPIVAENGYYRDSLIGQIISKRPNYIIISHETLGTYETLGDKRDPNAPQMFMWATVFKTLNPDFFAVDEAHQIKNPSTNRSKAARMLVGAKHIIPATASPVKNRTSEFWPPLFLVDPVIFPSYEGFINNYTIDGKRPKNVQDLQDLIRPVFLRRTKKQVLPDLPGVNRIQRFADLSERGKKLVEKAEAMVYERLRTFSARDEGGDEKAIFVMLEKILRLIQIASNETIPYTAELGQELVDQSDDETSKVLIFSRFKGTAYNIARLLGSEAICTVEKTVKKSGEPVFRSMNSDERDALFESARNDPKVRYIVTTTAAKEGHNLEFCNWVIFNELLWNPGDHHQCEGRAYGRLANPHPIDAFYVLVETEIVQWLWEINELKIEIIDETVEGVESSRDTTISVAKMLLDKLRAKMWQKSAA